tara:strand:- start:625 stop:906 length:282 start_codon:yes stop_codon:yes gene_type:complete
VNPAHIQTIHKGARLGANSNVPLYLTIPNNEKLESTINPKIIEITINCISSFRWSVTIKKCKNKKIKVGIIAIIGSPLAPLYTQENHTIVKPT